MILPECGPSLPDSLFILIGRKHPCQNGEPVHSCITHASGQQLHILFLLRSHIVYVVQVRVKTGTAAPYKHYYGYENHYRRYNPVQPVAGWC